MMKMLLILSCFKEKENIHTLASCCTGWLLQSTGTAMMEIKDDNDIFFKYNLMYMSEHNRKRDYICLSQWKVVKDIL